MELFDSPVKCTTPEPAKSRDPIFRSGVEFEMLKNPFSDQTECATFTKCYRVFPIMR